jgi:lysophospholipase L1-like esterase
MKVLFIGNSITRGVIGKSFVDLFISQYPDWIVKNAGVNGDTLKNISRRITKEIKSEPDYDFIVIEAGYNDIILPYLDTKGLLFRFALRYVYRNGRKPATPEKFERKYSQMIDFIRSESSSNIILTTLGCINENLSSVSNSKRTYYNDSIIKVATEHHCMIADVSGEMESVLKATRQTDYFLKNILNLIYFDKRKCKRDGGADKLSRKRNLILTIDGVHLNSAGAMIYKQTIEKQINKNGS